MSIKYKIKYNIFEQKSGNTEIDDWETIEDWELDNNDSKIYDINKYLKIKTFDGIVYEEIKTFKKKNEDLISQMTQKGNIFYDKNYTDNSNFNNRKKHDILDLSNLTDSKTLNRIINFLKNKIWDYNTEFPYDKYKKSIDDDFLFDNYADPRLVTYIDGKKEFVNPDFFLLKNKKDSEIDKKLIEIESLFIGNLVYFEGYQKKLAIKKDDIINSILYGMFYQEETFTNFAGEEFKIGRITKMEELIDSKSFMKIYNYFLKNTWEYDTTIPYEKYKINSNQCRILNYTFYDERPIFRKTYVNFNFFGLNYKPYKKDNIFWKYKLNDFKRILSIAHNNYLETTKENKNLKKIIKDYVIDNIPINYDSYFLRSKINEINKLKKKFEKEIDNSPINLETIYLKHFNKLLNNLENNFEFPNVEWYLLDFSEKEYYYNLSLKNPDEFKITKEQLNDLYNDNNAAIYCKNKFELMNYGCINKRI